MLGQRKYNNVHIKKWHIILVFLLLCACVFACVPSVFAESQNQEDIEHQLEQNVEDRLDDLDLSGLEGFDDMLGEYGLSSVDDMIADILGGKFVGQPSKVLDSVLAMFGISLKGLLPIMITLLATAIIFSIINGLSSGFINKSITEVTYFVCYCAVSVLLVGSIAHIIAITVQSISTMTKLMEAIFPILITTVTALGGVITAGVYQPLMGVLSIGIAEIIKGFVIPCFITTMALSIVGNISRNIKLGKLTKFFKSAGGVVLGFVFSIFMAFVTVQGITGAVSDSISVKSAKFAISSYVPILGGYISDGFDLVLASVVLVKNAVGMVGVIIMLMLVLSPVINIVAYLLGLRLIAGIIEPIGDKRMSEIVYAISDNLSLLIAALLGMAFMFFVIVTLVILTCNMGV